MYKESNILAPTSPFPLARPMSVDHHGDPQYVLLQPFLSHEVSVNVLVVSMDRDHKSVNMNSGGGEQFLAPKRVETLH